MSIFAKIKEFFGAGTVKVTLDVPASVETSSGQLDGKLTLLAASDQHLLTVTVMLEEEWESGRGDSKTTKTFELGKLLLAQGFDMKSGDSKEFAFSLPFELVQSNADRLKARGGALGALGSISAMASGEKSTYRVKAEADVKGAALDPSDRKVIQLA